ncbi:MAG: division/cell wall cluster transcriptional repressor MraZ [Eubacterium sp.]|nr:division/cell wall cluster transcriptional repressor MraZ [Eubacterium sp.]
MFMGTYQNSIDAKNRMIVPAKFREELGYKVVLTLGIDNCLYLYPMTKWEEFVEKLSKLPISDPNARKFARNFTGNAEELEVDRQGRITLPVSLREKVNITKELTTIGCMDKIEIWSRQEHEAAEDIQISSEEVAEGMIAYGI